MKAQQPFETSGTNSATILRHIPEYLKSHHGLLAQAQPHKVYCVTPRDFKQTITSVASTQASPICHIKADLDNGRSTGGITPIRKNRSTGIKTGPSATLSTINPILTDPRLNSDRHGDMPQINRRRSSPALVSFRLHTVQQDRQCTYNVTQACLRNTLAVEKQ